MPSRFAAGLIIPRLKSFDIDARRIHHFHDLEAILIPSEAKDAPIPPSIFERCFTCRLLTIRYHRSNRRKNHAVLRRSCGSAVCFDETAPGSQ